MKNFSFSFFLFSTDLTLLANFETTHADKNVCYSKPPHPNGTFFVSHYAGKVSSLIKLFYLSSMEKKKKKKKSK